MRKSLCFLAGVVLTLCALELLMRMLPVQSAVRMQPTGPAQSYVRYVPDQLYTYSHGWAFGNARRGEINHDGFNNSEPIRAGQPVMLIGDSYIESYMLPQPLTVQGQLGSALGGGGVAAAAASGNGLADSLAMLRALAPKYHPRQVVVFVDAGNVREMLTPAGRGHNSFAVQQGQVLLVHNPYVESKLKVLYSRSALVRYVYYNLKLSDYVVGKLAARADKGPRSPGDDRRHQVIDYYLAQLQQIEAGTGCRIVFLVDGDRKRIYSGAQHDTDWVDGERNYFLSAVRRAGFALADMQPVFEQHWRQHWERVDFLPVDRHWNSVGHQLAARQLLPLLGKQAPQ